MTKVYLVWDESFDTPKLLGVFSSEEKAIVFVRTVKGTFRRSCIYIDKEELQ